MDRSPLLFFTHLASLSVVVQLTVRLAVVVVVARRRRCGRRRGRRRRRRVIITLIISNHRFYPHPSP